MISCPHAFWPVRRQPVIAGTCGRANHYVTSRGATREGGAGVPQCPSWAHPQWLRTSHGAPLLLVPQLPNNTILRSRTLWIFGGHSRSKPYQKVRISDGYLFWHPFLALQNLVFSWPVSVVNYGARLPGLECMLSCWPEMKDWSLEVSPSGEY